MNSNKNRWIWIAVSAAGILLFCYIFRRILIYMIIAAVIGFVGDPIVDLMRKIQIRNRRLPLWFCAVATLSLFVSVFMGLFWLFAPLVAQEIALLSSLNVSDSSAMMSTRLADFSSWFDELGLEFSSDDLYQYGLSQVRDMMSFTWVTGLFNNFFGLLTSVIAGVFSVLFMSFFFLKDGTLFYKMIFTLTPDRHIERVKNILSHSHRMLTRYFGGLFIQVLLMMLMIGLGMWLFGVQNALLIAIFTGLVNVIPYIGPLLAICFGLIVGVTSGLGADTEMLIYPLVLKMLGVYAIAFFLDNWFIQPLVVGNSVNTHPLELFIILLMAATIGGVVGMALALPVYTILRIVAREFFEQFKVVETLTRDLDQN